MFRLGSVLRAKFFKISNLFSLDIFRSTESV